MRRALPLLLWLAAGPSGAADRTPVLVELFTSEGCSSCPAADEALRRLAEEQPVAGVEIVPFELHVDYWNSLGWADPFSLPEATARQERYARSASAPGYAAELYTPQMVVDGTRSFVGQRGLALDAIGRAAALPKRSVQVEPRPAAGGIEVDVQVSPGGEPSATLWLGLTESGLSSEVARGENRGRTLRHGPVARSLEQVATVPSGGWKGTVRLVISQKWQRERLSVVAFVQEKATGRMVGVGRARVPALASTAVHTPAERR